MSCFTEEYRKGVLEQIIDFLKNRNDMQSVIIVGSGAEGFRDKYSDIDLTVVIDDKTDTDTFLSDYQSFLDDTFSIMINHRVPGRSLAIALLENFLEIDISAVHIDQLSAVRRSWKVVYDKTGQAENIMQETFKNRKSADLSERIDGEFKAAVWGFWHYIIYSVVAIKRNDLWRANWEMEYVRNNVIQLLGLKYGIETKRNRDVKSFPSVILKHLQDTVPVEFTKLGFTAALQSLCNLVYDTFEEHFEKSVIEFPRDKMTEFISYVLE